MAYKPYSLGSGLGGTPAKSNGKVQGGVGAKSNPPKKNKQGGGQSILPPALSYDPSIDAQRRALGRGLTDVLQDSRRAGKFAKKDWATQRGDIQLGRTRGLEDINDRFADSLRDIGYQRADINTQAERGRQDFSTQLTNVIRNEQITGREQMQAANASGVIQGSTGLAAAARRGENLAIQRRAIDTARSRMEEDTAASLGRLGVTEGEVYADTDVARTRLNQDTSRNVLLGRRDYRRSKLQLGTQNQRARREATIGDLDLRNQAIFDAQQRKPGQFKNLELTLPKKKKKK